MLCLLPAFFPCETFRELGLTRRTVFTLPLGGLLGQTPHTGFVFRDDTKVWGRSWCAGATGPRSHLRSGWLAQSPRRRPTSSRLELRHPRHVPSISPVALYRSSIFPRLKHKRVSLHLADTNQLKENQKVKTRMKREIGVNAFTNFPIFFLKKK